MAVTPMLPAPRQTGADGSVERGGSPATYGTWSVAVGRVTVHGSCAHAVPTARRIRTARARIRPPDADRAHGRAGPAVGLLRRRLLCVRLAGPRPRFVRASSTYWPACNWPSRCILLRCRPRASTAYRWLPENPSCDAGWQEPHAFTDPAQSCRPGTARIRK